MKYFYMNWSDFERFWQKLKQTLKPKFGQNPKSSASIISYEALIVTYVPLPLKKLHAYNLDSTDEPSHTHIDKVHVFCIEYAACLNPPTYVEQCLLVIFFTHPLFMSGRGLVRWLWRGGGGISTKVVGLFVNALVLIMSLLLVLKGKSFLHPFLNIEISLLY